MNLYKATAPLDDAEALAGFLSVMPAQERFRKLLESGEVGWGGNYDPDAFMGHYVVSDGSVATRYTVTGITEAEAHAIAAQCDRLNDWTAQTMHDTVNHVLGTDFRRVQ